MVMSSRMLHEFFMIIILNIKMRNYPTLTGLEPKSQLPPQFSKTTATKETFKENAEPQQELLKM